MHKLLKNGGIKCFIFEEFESAVAFLHHLLLINYESKGERDFMKNRNETF